MSEWTNIRKAPFYSFSENKIKQLEEQQLGYEQILRDQQKSELCLLQNNMKYKQEIASLEERIKCLENQNLKYEEALWFYASYISWKPHLDDPDHTHSIVIFDDHEWVEYGASELNIGGRRARKALEE